VDLMMQLTFLSRLKKLVAIPHLDIKINI